ARAFNEWLENRRLRKEGEEYTDAVGRLTETVNRRIPQLRYAPAERAGVRRAARDVAAGRNTQESFGGSGVVGGMREFGFRVRPDFGQVLGYIQEGEPINLELPKRNAFEAEVDEGYRGQPFPQPPREMLRQRSFFSDSSSDFGAADPAQALRMDGFDAPQPPSLSARLRESGPGVEPLLERAGQRAAVEEGRAIQDMEAFMHGQVAEAEAEGFASAAEAAVSGAEAAAAAEVGGGALAAASEAALGVAGAAGAAAGGLAVAGAAAALVGTAWAIEGGLTAASHLMGWGGAAGSGTESGAQQHFSMHQARQRPEVIRLRARAARQQPSPFGINPVPLPPGAAAAAAKAVQDELMGRDVQYFPSSLSTFTPTTSRVARIPLTSGMDFIDPESVKIAFRVRNTDGGGGQVFPGSFEGNCFIKRVQLFSNGQRTDDISEYGRCCWLYSLLKPQEWYNGRAYEGFYPTNLGNPPAILDGNFRDALIPPTLIGLFQSGKMLP
ncbi:FV3-083R, partial [Symbiodinium microadriaticum]